MSGRIWWVVRGTTRWLFRYVVIYTWRMSTAAKDLHEPIPEVQSLIDVEVDIATNGDFELIRDVLVEPFASEFEEDFDERDLCFVAKVDGKIAGYSWLTFQPFELGAPVGKFDIGCGSHARYHADAAHIYGSQVLPEFRGKKIFQCLTREMYLYLKNKGYRYACNLIAVDNAASIAARARVGAKIDTLRFLKLPVVPLKVFGPPRHFDLERSELAEAALESSEH